MMRYEKKNINVLNFKSLPRIEMIRFWILTFLTLTFNLTLKFKITILMQFRSKFQNVVQNFRQVLALSRKEMVKFWTLTFKVTVTKILFFGITLIIYVADTYDISHIVGNG